MCHEVIHTKLSTLQVYGYSDLNAAVLCMTQQGAKNVLKLLTTFKIDQKGLERPRASWLQLPSSLDLNFSINNQSCTIVLGRVNRPQH
jgi:hypothetical protein